MRDGWYKVIRPTGDFLIREVVKNDTLNGSVHELLSQGCRLEEVFIFNHQELQKKLEEVKNARNP